MKNMFDLLSEAADRYGYNSKKRKIKTSAIWKKSKGKESVTITVFSEGKADKSREEYVHRKRQLKGYAHGMHRRPTKHESLLFNLIRDRFPYLPVKRQVVIMIDGGKTGYILDLFFPKRNLAIEVDGPSHEDQKQYDLIRDERVMKHFGIKTIRFTNWQIDNEIEAVYRGIRKEIDREHKAVVKKARSIAETHAPSTVSKSQEARPISEANVFLDGYLKRRFRSRGVQT